MMDSGPVAMVCVLRCIRCGRLMASAAAVVTTRHGPRYYGPKCARAAGFLRPRRHSPRIISRSNPQPADERQLDWLAL